MVKNYYRRIKQGKRSLINNSLPGLSLEKQEKSPNNKEK